MISLKNEAIDSLRPFVSIEHGEHQEQSRAPVETNELYANIANILSLNLDFISVDQLEETEENVL